MSTPHFEWIAPWNDPRGSVYPISDPMSRELGRIGPPGSTLRRDAGAQHERAGDYRATAAFSQHPTRWWIGGCGLRIRAEAHPKSEIRNRQSESLETADGGVRRSRVTWLRQLWITCGQVGRERVITCLHPAECCNRRARSGRIGERNGRGVVCVSGKSL